MTFVIFPTLSDLDLFSEITYWLTKRSGWISNVKTVQFGRWKGRGRVEGLGGGFGKWVEPANLPTPHYTWDAVTSVNLNISMVRY